MILKGTEQTITMITTILCVRMCVCVWCKYSHGRLKLMSSVFHDYALFYFTESEYPTESRAHHLASLASELAQRLPISSSVLGLQGGCHVHRLHVDAGILNSSPHTRIIIMVEN